MPDLTGKVALISGASRGLGLQFSRALAKAGADLIVTSRTLEPGDRFVIPDRNDLALWTGNAGGLEVWVDGEKVGTLGRSGAVVRDVSLAPDSLLTRLR